MSPRLAFPALAVLLLSIVVSPVWAQQALENPQPNSFQSGVGVISGWACNAQTIEISFDGGPRLRAATGTIREDTQGVCGDTNNGFGLLYNWNRLGDGAHTVTAYADGVEFASVTVSVTTLGAEFLRGVSGTFPLADFPTPGETRTLRWQQAQQNFVITAGNPQGRGTSGAAPHVLENPQPGSFQSGVGVISGWACEAQTIEISFDGGSRLPAGTGTIREDTQGVCGDTDNGFGLLYNWNRLGDGPHTVTAYADGVEFAEVTVTVTTLGQEFRRGLSHEVLLPDFPEVGTDVVLQWQEAQQNFVLSFAAPTSRLIDVTPTLTLPAGVSIQNVEITSLYSDTTTEVQASPQPTLVLAEDGGGTVLLGLANMDGGFLGEGHGEVDVSVASTAVVLVALAAGYQLPNVDAALVGQILAHPQWPAVTADLTNLLARDPNFLDRLLDYSETVDLIRMVATSLRDSTQADNPRPRTPEPRGPTYADAAGPSGSERIFAAQSGSVLPNGIRKENFGSGSPWRHYEPWRWFGEAKGGTDIFGPDNWLDRFLITLTRGGYIGPEAAADIVQEARQPPFLAQAIDYPALQAVANPNFADYALEMYDGEEYLGWVHVPRNATVYNKLRNGGAAYRSLSHPFTNNVDTVRFVRYRWSGFDTPQGRVLSFLNTFKLSMAAFHLISNTAAYSQWLHSLDPKAAATVIMATCITSNYDLPAWVRDDTGANVRRSLQQMVSRVFFDLHVASAQCLGETALGAAWVALGTIISKVMPQVAAQFASPLGWTLLAISAGNETVPVATSYFGGASVVEYHLGWTEEDDGIPYLACVSDEEPCILEAPENLRVTDIMETTALFEWDEVEGAEHYTMRIYAAEEVLRERMPRGETATVTGLEAGETYIFEVFATSTAGIDGEMATLPYEHNPPEPPEFKEAFYTFTLLENRDDHRGGVTVGSVRAIDPEGLRGIEYSLASGRATKFAVDGQTGVVRYIGRGEDYESGPRKYGLIVRATEVGEDGLSTDVRVTVEIEDEDELPYFGKEAYEFTVQVTHPSRNGRVLIGIVHAQDPEGMEVHHSLGRGDAARFSVSSDGIVTYCCYNDPLPGGEATHRLIVYAMNSDGTGPRIGVPVTVRLVGDDHPYQLIYCRRDRDVEIEGPDAGWAGRSSWHCIDTELKDERPELFTPYRVCNEYNRTHAWLRGPDAMLMEVIGEYRYLAQCVEDIPVEVSCIGSHQGFCGYWGTWD